MAAFSEQRTQLLRATSSSRKIMIERTCVAAKRSVATHARGVNPSIRIGSQSRVHRSHLLRRRSNSTNVQHANRAKLLPHAAAPCMSRMATQGMLRSG
eukprot:6183064-Pleurochrysis_carterae.AAC.1